MEKKFKYKECDKVFNQSAVLYWHKRQVLSGKSGKSGNLYKLDTKTTYLYKEYVVYPFVNNVNKGEKLLHENTELCKVLAYIEKSCMAAL